MCWRVVEAQHVVSTMALVDTLEEQALLERILDDSKPALPVECVGLHYLLFTPFRHGALHPDGSRFRRAGLTPGVFYASQAIATAVAEMAFWRLLFYARSPTIPWPENAADYTVFSVRYAGKGVDLTRPPLDAGAAEWSDPVNYAPTQALADTARAAGAQVIRYPSARAAGRNVALLTCAAFRSKEPEERRRWKLHVGPSGARAIGEQPDERLAFDRAAFVRDPRIAAMRWERPQAGC
jgi:hypothetical protein